MKRLLTLLTALAMCLSLGVTALAADDGPDKFVLPYPDQVNIWLDGRYMTFTDAMPAEINGRTQAPYRAVLEALGAQVDYDEATGGISAVFEDGTRIDMALGSNIMTCTKSGVTNTVTMDVTPYLDNASGRTFVPVRFIGEALGLTVTWNNYLQTAYLVDWDKTVKEIDENFKTFNEFVALSANSQTQGKNYKSDDNITLKISDGQVKKPAVVSIKGSSLTDGVDMSGKYTLGLDLGGFATGAQDEQMLLAMLNGADFELIANDKNGFFLRSPLLVMISSGMIPEKGWFGITAEDMSKLTVVAGTGSIIDTEKLTQLAQNGQMTLGTIIRLILEDGSMSNQMMLPPDAVADMLASIYKGILGDDSIKVTKTGSTVKYTCKADEKSIFAFMREMGATEQDMAEFLNTVNFDFTMTMTAKNGIATNATAKMTMDIEGTQMTMDMSANTSHVDMTIKLAINNGPSTPRPYGELKIAVDMKETDEAPLQKPADGEPVVTLTQLIDLLSGALSQSQLEKV